MAIIACLLLPALPDAQPCPTLPCPALQVIEFTYNEPEDEAYDSPSRRGFEELLRKLLKLKNGPALVLLHHYAWWFTYGDGLQYGRYYRAGEGQLQVFANVSGASRERWSVGSRARVHVCACAVCRCICARMSRPVVCVTAGALRTPAPPARPVLPLLLQYYDFPAVSMRNVLWPLMNAGIEGFKVQGFGAPAAAAANHCQRQ